MGHDPGAEHSDGRQPASDLTSPHPSWAMIELYLQARVHL